MSMTSTESTLTELTAIEWAMESATESAMESEMESTMESEMEFTMAKDKPNADHSRVFIPSAKDSVACQAMMSRFAAHVATMMPSASDLAYTPAHRGWMHS